MAYVCCYKHVKIMITDEDLKMAEKIKVELGEYLRVCLPKDSNYQERLERINNFLILKIAKLSNMVIEIKGK